MSGINPPAIPPMRQDAAILLNDLMRTPEGREFVRAALNQLNLLAQMPASSASQIRPLHTRLIVQPERYMEQLIPARDGRAPAGPAPAPGGHDAVVPLVPPAQPQADGDAMPSPTPGPFPAPVPFANHETLLLLLNYLNQLLTLSSFSELNPKAPDHTTAHGGEKPQESRPRPESVPIPKGQPPVAPSRNEAAPGSGRLPAAALADSAGLLSQLTSQAHRAALQLSAHSLKQVPTPIQGRASASTHAPSNKGVPDSDEWIFRLMGIQAAARGMAAMQAEKPGSATAAQMAVAMSRLYTQFAKLQQAAQGKAGENMGAGHVGEHILATARNRLQAYLEHMGNLLKNADANFSPAQLANILQRAQQEEGWLRTLIEFLETRQEPAKNPNLTKTAVDPSTKQAPSEKTTTPAPTLDKNAAIPQMDASALTSKEAASLAAAQRMDLSGTTTQILQPRSGAELLGMVQAHMAKNPLATANVLIPYPMGMMKEAGIRDGVAADGTNKEQRRGPGKSKRMGKESSQVMCLVPAGPVIVGDSFKEGREEERPCQTEQLPAFLLAATPVTNGQFANWLNDQLEKKMIHMPRPGFIYDLEDRLLCTTIESAPMSQIEIAVEQGELHFRPVAHRENHPVVHVSWWGAQTFCASNGLVLPSEAQWERGGGMLPTARGQPIKKLRYGCPVDELTNQWANYMPNTQGRAPTENRTLAVGFFDGLRVLTIAGKRVETMRAASPWGCFDMSGNVREWIDEDYDDTGHFRLTKGGSYADRPFDLRLAARLPLVADSTDPFTGFRTAFPLPAVDIP